MFLFCFTHFAGALLLLHSKASSHFTDKSPKYTDYINIFHHLLRGTDADVHLKGSPSYYDTIKVENGLCRNILPDLVVVPKSTKDVATIVRISRRYGAPLSVRSGGHSYICSNIKPKGIHIDLRSLDKVKLTSRHPFSPPGPALLLGPGSTWDRVLNIVPTDRYTMVHGQCYSVGVGGYLIGGGSNIVGTTQRLGTGAFNVLQFTMVDAEGNVIKASESNVTVVDPENGNQQQIKDSHNLFRSLQFAGSSFGIVTEFHYRIFDGPELLPAFAQVYFDGYKDLLRYQKAALDGRYNLSLYVGYFFTPLNWFSHELAFYNALRALRRIWPFLQFQRKRPIITIAIVDNYPSRNEKTTKENAAYSFLKEYKIKLVAEKILSDSIPRPTGQIYDYQSIYRTSMQRQKTGARPIASANFMNLTNILSIKKLLLNHPLFGLRNIDSTLSAKSQCEFCFLSIASINSNIANGLATPILSLSSFTSFKDVIPIESGNFQLDMTCHYKPNINSMCPKVVKRAKTSMRNAAVLNGERLTQYWNTPSCDTSKDFKRRYWSDKSYKMLHEAKRFWDPQNVFNHCQSVGSTVENCCPPDL